jgi:LAGLIDADG endonuclease
VSSDNPTGAGNQQERQFKMLAVDQIDPAIGHYIAGFVDGEGSFMLKFRPRQDFTTGWKVSLTFNVSQKDEVILALLKRHIGCGTMFEKGGGVWMYEVNNLSSIRDHVVPFFRRFSFLSAKKKRDFATFEKMLEMFLLGSHKTPDGIRELLTLRRNMNDGGKRKFSEDQILASLLIS